MRPWSIESSRHGAVISCFTPDEDDTIAISLTCNKISSLVPNEMKVCKLWIHAPDFSEDELVLSNKDFADVKPGDLVEISVQDDQYSCVLLQVKTLTTREDLPKDTISIAQSVAKNFNLQLYKYKDVNVQMISNKDVSLDLMEVMHREQYFGRADMWRMKKSLVNTCVYLNKRLTFAEMRADVSELWARGEKVTCGYVTEKTRMTFRSSSAQVNIFIQMSSEMWQFDNYGDLFFEKAVDGFLMDLFTLWKEKNCGHDVTIMLFSRVFYQGNSIDDFPASMRDYLQVDYRGRFYEDFYRIIVQNERYDDWMWTTVTLKSIFHEYLNRLLKYHEADGLKAGLARISSACDGNFLEVLNMGLNAFEKYYIDRNFDRTGKISVVITPGSGVFDVDRDLAHITKQRTIDCGSNSDLVCLAEQPLHVVPLFRFRTNNPLHHSDSANDYSLPHWLNHSFYTSKVQAEERNSAKFVPRVQIPPVISIAPSWALASPELSNDKLCHFLPANEMPVLDFDAYDASVFDVSSHGSRSKSRHSPMDSATPGASRGRRKPRVKYKSSVNTMLDHQLSSPAARTMAVPIGGGRVKDRTVKQHSDSEFMPSSFGGFEGEHNMVLAMAGSVCSPVGHEASGNFELWHHRPQRVLVNPFTPMWLYNKVTSNRRRWAHVFPPSADDNRSKALPHHLPVSVDLDSLQTSPAKDSFNPMTGNSRSYRGSRRVSLSEPAESGLKIFPVATSVGDDLGEEWMSRSVQLAKERYMRKSLSTERTRQVSVSSNASSPNLADMEGQGHRRLLTLPSFTSQPHDLAHWWLLGANGEQSWTLDLKKGMDWRSMVCPASLPLTTDYKPDEDVLNRDYVMSPYQLLPNDVLNPAVWQKPATPYAMYRQMAEQRVAQGFQVVLLPSRDTSVEEAPNPAPVVVMSAALTQAQRWQRQPTTSQGEEHEITLSIGRIFHILSLKRDGEISVIRYWPRHPYPQKTMKYSYRFQVPDSNIYDASSTHFSTEKLENYNWNYVDHYILSHGDEDYTLNETLKYWRARFFLLPSNNATTKRIMDGAERCDIYERRTTSEKQQLINSFLRFIEAINKIKRPVASALAVKPKAESMSRKGTITVASDRDRHKSAVHSSGFLLDAGESLNAGSLFTPSPNVKGQSAEAISDNSNNRSRWDELNINSPLADIVEAMFENHTGLPFINKKQQDLELPDNTFIAVEAIGWLKEKVDDVTSVDAAIDLMKKLVASGYVVHASGHRNHAFYYGFYLYCLLPQPMDKDKKGAGLSTLEQFRHEWCEVAIDPAVIRSQGTASLFPSFFLPSLPTDESPTSTNNAASASRSQSEYKQVKVDVDPRNISDRDEWGTARYHATYLPCAAFELEIQWLVATGAIFGELVISWSRKASPHNFHFIPVPCDPFALPFTVNSDPLRGPIFIRLHAKCLYSDKSHPFHEFSEETRARRMQLFKDSILRRFGFLSSKPTEMGAAGADVTSTAMSGSRYYVHCSGGMFVMMPDVTPSSRQPAKSPSFETDLHSVVLDRADRLTTSVEGFLWAWNFMLTRKWRTNVTGDEVFQDKMLEDFRAFCSDAEGRLTAYWNSCRQQAALPFTPHSAS